MSQQDGGKQHLRLQASPVVLASIVGFAFNQGFIYALFYLEATNSLQLGSLYFERADLFGTLLFMSLAFYAIANLPQGLRSQLLAPRFALLYACLLVLGSGVPAFIGQQDLVSVCYESICVGVPAALMLCAWGMYLGEKPVEVSAPIAFLGLALGAALCFLVSLIPVSGAYAVLYFAPLGSALLLRHLVASEEGGLEAEPYASRESDEAGRVSLKILVGTAVFGLATGLTEVFASGVEDHATLAAPVMMLLFVLFCLAALQVSIGRPWFSFALHPNGGGGETGRNRASAQHSDGSLGNVYRLAILLMMAGFLLTPVLGDFGIGGESIVQVGFLGITVVLISLFLAMAHVSSKDAALSFAQGFGCLFAGELVGILLGNGLAHLGVNGDAAYILVVVAGVAALYAYLFLFTERDIDSLTLVLEEVDQFDAAVRKIAEEAGLSKRESEILPLALRGRTGERIAGELFISKNTVETHLRRIYAKCGVHSRQELIDLGEKTEKELSWR